MMPKLPLRNKAARDEKCQPWKSPPESNPAAQNNSTRAPGNAELYNTRRKK